MPYAGVGGRRFYYEVGGEGETVVLLHGSFANLDILEAPATAISSGFRAIRFDRRGHGRSSDAAEPLPLSEEAAEIAALLDWFSADKAHLLTHDDASEIALQFAFDFPDRTLSLALLAPTLEGFAWNPETLAARHDLLASYARDPRRTMAEAWLRVADLRRRARARDRLRAPRGHLRSGAPVRRVARAAPHAGPAQALRLGEIRARTAIFAGDREEKDRLRCASALVRGIPGAEGIVIPGASRFLHMEDPRHVMRRLTDFYIPPENKNEEKRRLS